MRRYFLAIDDGVRAVLRERAIIKGFVAKHKSRASTLFEAALVVDDQEASTVEIAGLDDAMSLVKSIGREHSWLMRAVIETLSESS